MASSNHRVRGGSSELHEFAIAFDRAIAAADRAGAEAYATRILERWPREGAILHGVACALVKFGPGEIALAAARAACACTGGPAMWRVHRASLERACGDVDAALDWARAAVMQDETLVEAWIELAGALLERGDHHAAASALDRVFALGGSSAALHVNRSFVAATLGQWETAQTHALAAVRCDPSWLPAQVHAATVEGHVLGYDVALARLDQIDQRDARVLRARAGATIMLKEYDRALGIAGEIIAVDPQDHLGHEIRLAALRGLGRDDDALAFVDGLSDDADPRLLVQASVTTMDFGQRERTIDLLRRALRRDPDLAFGWYNLSETGAFDVHGEDVDAMERLLRRSSTSAHGKVLLHFALGRARSACGDYARSWEHFQAGNAAKRATLGRFDVGMDEQSMLALAQEFNADMLARTDSNASPSEQPVFVVGMPRSGTSLVEALLASHPEVYGAGELLALTTVAGQRHVPNAWSRLATEYLGRLPAAAAPAARVVDKLPLNFLYLGLVRKLFPNARIIHCRRNAVDRGLSCFTTLFDEGNEFSYDLVDIGRFTRAYHRLMEHWRSNIPADRFIEVDYESIVANVEDAARRLVAFLDLPWHPAVMRFHETSRAVRTASRLQIRRPIYATSMNRAAAFGAALDPLRTILARDE